MAACCPDVKFGTSRGMSVLEAPSMVWLNWVSTAANCARWLEAEVLHLKRIVCLLQKAMLSLKCRESL